MKLKTDELQDLSTFRYIFLSRWHAGENGDDKNQHLASIWDSVNQAWDWLFATLNIQPKPLEKPVSEISRRESQIIADSDWVKSTDESISLIVEARLILDSAFIKIGIWKHGISSNNDINSLRQALKTYEVLKSIKTHIWLGEIDCLYAEISDKTDDEQMSKKILEEQIKNIEEEIPMVQYSWGTICTPQYHKKPILVLSKPDKKSLESSSWFINYILPRLALSFTKIDLDYNVYDKLRPEIEKSERELAKELKGRVQTGSLKELETRIISLSNLQDKLVEDLGQLRQRIIGMDTNLSNMRLALRNKILDENHPDLWHMFGEKSSLDVQQMKVDMNYFHSRMEEAQLALTTLSALVDVERGKMDRLLFAILGLVGLVISLIDGFSEEFSVQVKVAIVLTGTIMGALIFYLGRGRWSRLWRTIFRKKPELK